ncbi:MAG TPA: FkbM family methyltransferase [Candidatus Limnocylindria bacterium]|nr:FkbM family methyltransferase [Candidatus Limnocylindria bacterium]
MTVVRMQRGFELELDLRDPLQRHLAAEREYEPEVSWIYPYLLRTGDAFVDGGAHIGYLTLLGSSCVGPTGSVHSFEPVPLTHDALACNVARNHARNVRLNRVALGPRAGTLELELPIDPRGEGILAWGATAIQVGRGAVERVPMTALDEYAERARLRSIRVLKLDLEGAELGALEGARGLLRARRVEHLIVELNTYLLDLAGERYDERRALLASYGYRCYQLTKSGRIVAQAEPIVTRDVVVTDLLFAA